MAIGVLQLGLTISLAALIFSGPLSAGAGRAAAGFVLGTAIVSLIVGWTSKLHVVVAGAQDTAAVLVAAVAAAIVASPELRENEIVPTVIVMIAITGVATGVVFWLIGHFGLTSFVRFLPFPVITGFAAGTGWLLLRGGIEVMHGRTLTWQSFADLAGWSEFKFLAPGLLLAIVMLAIVNMPRVPNSLASVAILSGTVVFHVIGRSVSSFAELEADGWFIGPFVSDSRWSPIGASDVDNTNWAVLADNVVLIAAVVAVSVVGMLLNLSGLEGGPDPRIDMNAEMRGAGPANVLVGLTGGLIGYHLLGNTLLGRQIGGRGRSVPIVISVMAAVAFFLGPDLIANIPRAVAGGVLGGMGISLLTEWARTSMRRMNRTDQALSALILLIIAVFGVLTGVGAGVIVAAAVFIVKYSRTNPVRHVIEAAGRSRIDRHAQDQALLEATPESVVAFELQGYLFFGSITGLRRVIDERLDGDTTEFVIIDFKHVTGIDSTAASGLASIVSLLADRDIATLLSGLRAEMDKELQSEDTLVAQKHQDLDHAIAACENELVAAAHGGGFEPQALAAPFRPQVMNALQLPSIEIRAGATLIAVGETDRDMYFLESGSLTAWLERDDGQPVRIRQMVPGAVIGEIAFVTGARRTATVTADTDVVVRVLRRKQFESVAQSQPDIALEIQDELLRRIAVRLTSSSVMVRDLLQ